MGLETASFINGLNSSWPLGTDSATKGDDHFRLIKSVLKNTFPGASGTGFSKQITATEDEINYLSGLDANIMTKLSGVGFPAGTVLPFYNATPPPGWSLVTMPTTYMLVCGVTGGTTSGTDNPILNDKVASHTHAASGGTLSTAGAHSHGISPGQVVAPDALGAGNIYGGTGGVTIATISETAAGDHTHSLTGLTIGANSGAANWTPRYAGVILCSKD